MLTAVVVLTALVLAGVVYQWIGARRDSRRFPPPGEFIGTGSCRVHVHGTGAGRPAVILEAGIAASSVGWARVRPRVAEFTRVIAYDRAGLGWSSPAAGRRSAGQFLADLDAVVQHTGAPVILVAHSFGALLARLYAAAHPQCVAGLVLVDPALTAEWAEPSPDRLRALTRGVRLSRRGAMLAHLGIVRLGLLLATAGFGATAKLVTRVSSDPGGSAAVGRLAGEVRKLPAEVWPLVAAHWSRPQGFRSMAEHLAALPEVAAAAARVTDLGDLPLVVISGSHLRPEQQLEHQSVALTSTRGRHVIAQGSGHWVHVDAPEFIVDAVRSLLSEHHR